MWRAHVPVTNEQHDVANGLISGFCERCRTPWPCKYSPESARERAYQAVVEALRHAKQTIRAWHGMGMEGEQGEIAWDIYNQQAPEMKMINDALATLDALEGKERK
jgi:hypothetical protein